MFPSLKVLEVGGGLAGAFCCSHFVQFGSAVHKVENASGDWTRSVPASGRKNISALFACLNRGKRSIALDLDNDRHIPALLGLAGQFDLVVYDRCLLPSEEGMALRTKLIEAKAPSAVMCCISAFGEKGPWAGRPGSEFIAQATSGYWRYVSGPSEEPLRVGAYVATVGTGIFAAQGIMAAFLKRARRSGGGDVVEVNLLQSLLALKTHHIAGQYEPDSWVGTRATGATDEPQYGWRAGDGKHLVFSFAFGSGKADGWRDFCHAVGISDRVIDEQLAEGALQTTGIGRAAHQLRSLYESYFKNFKADELVRLVREHDGTASLYDDYDGLMGAHRATRHVFGSAGAADRQFTTVDIPWLLDKKPIHGENEVSDCGQHTIEALRDLGFTGEQIRTITEQVRPDCGDVSVDSPP